MILNTDGGARGNPGPGAAGAVLKDDNGTVVSQKGIFLGTCTNNEAEYKALILGLKLALEHNANDLTCYLDSELVVKQLNGQYRVKNENLRVIFNEAKSLAQTFDSIKYQHVPRTKNKEADQIVNDVLDASV